MEVIISCGRDDTIVPAAPSLIETPNDGPEMEAPISRLPTELITLIFQQCESDIRHRLTLTHICRRWRQIAVSDPSLWTNIHIQTSPREQNERLDHLLSILGMQLDRTGNLPLDVEWIADFADEFLIATVHIIRENAPFSRWRALKAFITDWPHEDAPWSSSDAFTNLETLQVGCETDDGFIRAIDRTVTSRLKILDLRGWYASQLEESMTSFTNCFAQVSTFIFECVFATLSTPILPDNVVNLRLWGGASHPFPHIRTYEVDACIFHRGTSIHLGSMTVLIAVGGLKIDTDCQVLLPALRELKLGTLRMSTNTRLEAPSLDALHFTNINYVGNATEETVLPFIDESLLEPGYLLSPNTSITVDSHLLTTTLITILAKSPKVAHATLRFDDWASAQVILGLLIGLTPGADPGLAESEILCPRLSELRLNFEWRLSEPSASKEWLSDMLKYGNNTGRTAHMSIYASWKGEGTYVRLMGD